MTAASYSRVISLQPSEGSQSPSGPSSPPPCGAASIPASFDNLSAIQHAAYELDQLASRASKCIVALDGLVCFDYTYEALCKYADLQQNLANLLGPLNTETIQGYTSAGDELLTVAYRLHEKLPYARRVMFETFQEKLSESLELISKLINDAKGLNPESLDADHIDGSSTFERCHDALKVQLPLVLSIIRKHENLLPGHSLKAEYRDWYLRWRILFEFFKDFLSGRSRLGQSFANQLGRLDRGTGRMSERSLFSQFAHALRECQGKMNENIAMEGKRGISVLGEDIAHQDVGKRFKPTPCPPPKRSSHGDILSGKRKAGAAPEAKEPSQAKKRMRI